MPLERIIITLKKNGTFRGASAQDYDGQPAPLTDAAVTALFPTLNTAAMDRVTDLESRESNLQNKIDALQASLASVQAAATAAGQPAIAETARVALLTKRQAERDRLAAELAAKQAELDAIDNAP